MNKPEIFSVNYDLEGDLNLLKVQYLAMLVVVENQEDVLFEHHSLKAGGLSSGWLITRESVVCASIVGPSMEPWVSEQNNCWNMMLI
ncbi:hypothetical protein ACSBR1_016188 [Camellia fascicularis]